MNNTDILEKPYVVGVDVGGQTTKMGIVDMRGQVLSQTVIRTDTIRRSTSISTMWSRRWTR